MAANRKFDCVFMYICMEVLMNTQICSFRNVCRKYANTGDNARQSVDGLCESTHSEELVTSISSRCSLNNLVHHSKCYMWKTEVICVTLMIVQHVLTLNPLLHMAFQRSSALQSSDEQFHQSRKLKELY